MKKLLAIFSAILLFVYFTGCNGCSSEELDGQSAPSYSAPDPTKDNIADDIEW